jgi:hypothetical protein
MQVLDIEKMAAVCGGNTGTIDKSERAILDNIRLHWNQTAAGSNASYQYGQLWVTCYRSFMQD